MRQGKTQQLCALETFARRMPAAAMAASYATSIAKFRFLLN